MKRLFSGMATTVLMAGLLAGCGGGNGNEANGNGNAANGNGAKGSNEPATETAKEVKLEFWTISLQPKFNDYFNNLFAAYQKDHPNVKIDWKDYPYDGLQSQLLTSIAGGSAPDVVNLNTELANQMGSKGALVDMNQEITPETKAAYFDGIYKSTEIDGKAYGLPWYTSSQVLFINKAIAEKAGLDVSNPPKTREDLLTWARQVKEKTGIAGYAQQVNSNLLAVDGVPLLSEDKKKAGFNTDAGYQAIENQRKLYEDGIIPKEDANFDKQVTYFASQQVAFELSGSTFINRLQTAAPDVYKQTMAVPMPLGKAGSRFSNTMNIAVPAKSDNVKEAVEFAAFLTNAQNQLEFAKVANTLPSTKDSIKDPFFSQDDGTLEAQAKIASSQGLENASDFLLGVEKAGDINTTIVKHLQNIFLNKADVKAEMDAAAKEVEGLLQ
ncbi:ABC transporter substrate-binding protein [Paenibacillus gansuensis]|uniref:ABC transporter substrate-binding protein n=1 Tax=Paenibacillus gansuensis TaxID=306542 RepID=A0ABW5PJF4_9BACL